MSDLILSNNELVNKFFRETKLDFYYPPRVVKHLKIFIVAAISKGFTAKTTDIAEFSTLHRTTIGHFLSDGVWDERYIDQVIKNTVIEFILFQSTQMDQPIFVSTDDTVCKKTKPSSQAKSPIENAGFHFSHLLSKSVWGHQVLATTIGCMGHTFNYDIQRYDKENGSKIDYMMKLAESLPLPKNRGYALFDSWFTCGKVFDAYAKQGYHCIGALKTNRIIYPKGIRISVANFSQFVKKNDVNLVTVNHSKYWVYRYEGALNDIANAVVLLSWPENAFGKPKALKAFISTDIDLDDRTILTYYTHRWPIEVFFKQEKQTLGFDKYQIRSIKGIERLWLLESLVHLMCTIGLNQPMKFGDGLRKIRKQTKREQIAWIYQCAKNNVPFEEVAKSLKVA